MKTNTFSRRSGYWISGLLIGLASAATVQATELVYHAQAQNDHDDPDLKSRSSVAGTSALERFTSQLQSRLLGQLLDNISTGNTGSLSTDSFIVNVIDDSGALSIEVTDRASGEVSEIQVNGLNP
jgi:curli production assembly/transport component CsgF